MTRYPSSASPMKPSPRDGKFEFVRLPKGNVYHAIHEDNSDLTLCYTPILTRRAVRRELEIPMPQCRDCVKIMKLRYPELTVTKPLRAKEHTFAVK